MICSLLLNITLSILFSAPKAILDSIDKLDSNKMYDLELKKISENIIIYSDDVDMYWRLARVHFELADQSQEKKMHKKHFYPGLEAAKKALILNSFSYEANHWYAVLIGKIGLLEGTEKKIKNSYEVKKYALKAIELNPDNDGTYHVMGRWHYELANLSWIEKKIASWVYETPPKGGFEDAIIFFNKAIENNPEDIRNHLWLGKTYLKKDNIDKAKNSFKLLLNLKPSDNSDRNMQNEAEKILKQF